MARLTFTDRAIAAVRVPVSGQADYYDKKTPGLGIRVSYGGSKTFFIKYQDPLEMKNGKPKQKRKSLGPYPAMKLSEAREKALAYRHSLVIDGIDPAEAAKRRKAVLTFSQLRDLYIEHAKINKRSWKEDQRILSRYFSAWEDRKATEISREDLAARLAEISSQNGGVQANRCLACIRHVYNWAYRSGKIAAHNPAVMIDRPHKETSRDRVLNATELKALWDAFESMGTAGMALRLLMLTGQRLGEITALKWSDITDDTDGKIFTIDHSNYKTARTHVVPLSDRALSVLEQVPIIEGNPYVFASTRAAGKPITIGSKIRNEARNLSGVEDFNIHDLRRTLATNARPLGFTAEIGDRVMGHVISGVSGIYNRYDYLPEKRALLDAWARFLDEITGDGGNVVQMQMGP